MSIAGVGVFSYSATITPPIHRLDPAGNGVVVADWVPGRPETVTIRRFDEYGRLTRESTIEAELRPIPSSVKREFIDEGMKKAEGPYQSVWATSTNELDVPFIAVYELVRPGGCG